MSTQGARPAEDNRRRLRRVNTAAAAGLVLAVGAVASGQRLPLLVFPFLALVTCVTLTARRLFRWETMVALLAAVIFLIPIKRYVTPGASFNLEPYRIYVAFLAGAWFGALMVDPRIRLRRTGLEGPVGMFVFAMLASVAANDGRIRELGIQKDVVKTLTFFGSFLIILFLVVSVARTYIDIHRVVHTVVVCATTVAFFGLIESRTHFNIFNHLHPLLPGLQFQDPAYTAGLTPAYLSRSGVERIYASSAHPIELSAVLVMVIPLAVYLKRVTGQRRWIIAALLLALATLATLSRTGFLMMLVTLLVFLWLRPVETRRLWPWVVPVVLACAIVVPHTLTSLYDAFFPKGGLIAQQDQRNVGSQDGGRLTDIGPSLREYEQHPLLGEGFGTRISQRLGVLEGRVGAATARILDDQWLGSLLETGAIGFLSLVWLFVRPIRRLARRAKADSGPEGWLAAALAASLTSFAISMLTFDAFGFVQVTILTFLLLALSSSLLKLPATAAPPAARR